MRTRARHVSRRAALRGGAAVSAMGTGLMIGGLGMPPGPARAAADVAWRRERLQVDFTPVDPVSSVRAGSGSPMRGDTFYMDGPVYAREDVGGTQTGMYHSFGAWTTDATDTDAAYQLVANVQFRFFGEGSIMGLTNGGGTEPGGHEGAVLGGTGRFAGAQGTFRQQVIRDGPPIVVRVTFDLILPERDS